MFILNLLHKNNLQLKANRIILNKMNIRHEKKERKIMYQAWIMKHFPTLTKYY